MFRDAQHAWNPSPNEIRTWAYSDLKIPEQDWELAVNSFDNIPMICSFIEDKQCKHISFFLGSLYVFTGDIVKAGIKNEIDRLKDLLLKIEKTATSEELKAWITRSKTLLQDPSKYNYAYWGLGSKYVY